MSWGSNYDKNRDLGHATARARADADAAAQKALERKREQQKSAPSWVTTPPRATTSHLSRGSLPPIGPAGRPRQSLPTAPPAEVRYPRDQDLAELYPSRHPEIYGLHLDHRVHPFTGEKVLEIMWEDTLPRGREFIPLSVLGKNWSGVRSQGVTLPFEVRRDRDSFALRWLPPPFPAPPTRTPSPRDLKVMLGLPGADKKPTFTLMPGSTTGNSGADGGSAISDLMVKAAAVALISGAGAATAWWRNRGGHSN